MSRVLSADPRNPGFKDYPTLWLIVVSGVKEPTHVHLVLLPRSSDLEHIPALPGSLVRIGRLAEIISVKHSINVRYYY